jgi:hypothetical protein
MIVALCVITAGGIALVDSNSVFSSYGYELRVLDALYVLVAGVVLSREAAGMRTAMRKGMTNNEYMMFFFLR